MATLRAGRDPRVGKVAFDLKLAFGIGQAAEGLKNGAFGTFLIFYYNQVLGMSGSLAGLAIGIALIVDAMTDPLAGSISDRWHSRHGRRHPFMYASIVPLAITFYLLFAPPVEGEWALFIWLVIFTNLSRTAMTLYHVPHLALGAEMSTDFVERSKLVGYRQFFATFGALGAVAIGFVFFFRPSAEFANGQLDARAYEPFAATLAVLMSLTIFWSAWGTRRVIPFLPMAPPGALGGVIGVFRQMMRDILGALRAKSFSWLFSGVLIVFVMVGVDSALNIYMYTYFWELDRADIVWLAVAYPVGLMIGTMFAPAIQARFGKKGPLMFGTLCWTTFQIFPVVLRLLGWFPENDSALLLPLLMGIRVLQGMGTVQSNVAFGSMMADVADEHELTTGRRQEGIFFAASSFSAKCASGMGNIIAGVALDLISWPRGAHIKTAADVPTDALVSLGLLYGPIVAGFGFVSAWCYTHYHLTRERHAEILVELAERHAAADGQTKGVA
jgi:glycoside/pentoside/hexuronide:cation symporter, GPH family